MGHAWHCVHFNRRCSGRTFIFRERRVPCGVPFERPRPAEAALALWRHRSRHDFADVAAAGAGEDMNDRAFCRRQGLTWTKTSQVCSRRKQAPPVALLPAGVFPSPSPVETLANVDEVDLDVVFPDEKDGFVIIQVIRDLNRKEVILTDRFAHFASGRESFRSSNQNPPKRCSGR
jgi:hypothetical protein